MYVCLCTHSVLDNNMYQDSSSSVHNNNRSEGNTGTSRSQPTTGRAHYQGRQLPQIPTLKETKKTHQETWFPWQKQILKEVLSWNHFCPQDMKSLIMTNHKGELEWCTKLLSGLFKVLMMNFLWVWCLNSNSIHCRPLIQPKNVQNDMPLSTYGRSG